VQALDLAIGRGDGTPMVALDFRLDSERRGAITRRVLAEHYGGVPREVLDGIAEALEPGAAVLAVIEPGAQDAATALDDTAERNGGLRLCAEAVEARTLADVADRLASVVASAPA
jgi:hypothetical protein